MYIPRVLIVDHSAAERQRIKEVLQKNFDIAGEATTGKETVEMYMKLYPNVVTMEIELPEMNGIETLRAIKALDPKAKLVMVTAMSYEEYVKECIKLGVSGFIVKPFQPEKLITAVQKAYGNN